jgi:hypothetical protein
MNSRVLAGWAVFMALQLVVAATPVFAGDGKHDSTTVAEDPALDSHWQGHRTTHNLPPLRFGSPGRAVSAITTGFTLLRASDRDHGDDFGFAVAVDGDTAVVGAYDNGAAYIFVRDPAEPETWNEIAILRQSDATSDGDLFGFTVAISGDTVVVGAEREDGGPGNPISNAGAAYVFERDQGGSGAWGEVAILRASDAQAMDYFASSVAISGDTIAVGAPYEDGGLGEPVSDCGGVYIFERDAGGPDNWGEVKTLRASDREPSDRLGSSVALSGDTLVGGAKYEDGDAGDPLVEYGAAYVFERDLGGTDEWGESAILRAADPRANDQFGNAVTIEGNSIVVGARWADGGPGDSLRDTGTATLFQRDAGGLEAWGEVAVLRAADPQEDDYFGIAVAISGDTIAVGAAAEDGGAGDPVRNSGAVYLFQENLGVDGWGQRAVLRPAGLDEDDLFGLALSLSGDTLLSGTPGDDGPAADPTLEGGAVYAYLIPAQEIFSDGFESGNTTGWLLTLH